MTNCIFNNILQLLNKEAYQINKQSLLTNLFLQEFSLHFLKQVKLCLDVKKVLHLNVQTKDLLLSVLTFTKFWKDLCITDYMSSYELTKWAHIFTPIWIPSRIFNCSWSGSFNWWNKKWDWYVGSLLTLKWLLTKLIYIIQKVKTL